VEQLAHTFLILGSLLLLGFLSELLRQFTNLPRVTLLLLLGFLIGPSVFNLLPDLGREWFPFISNLALVMVGFLLGEKLQIKKLRQTGLQILPISLTVVLVTAMILLAGLLLIGVPLELALLLAACATATDPAATSDVVHETRSRGAFTDTLLGIVAVDDAWALIMFVLLLAATISLQATGDSLGILLTGSWELLGAVLLGVLLGLPMAYLTGRIRPGEPTLIEALGTVMLCVGLAHILAVSFLLAAVIMGATVANLAHHHTRPFHAIEGIEGPFMVLFFVLAGASLELHTLPAVGLAGIGYMILRFMARVLGAELGCRLFPSGRLRGSWLGLALMPQAGVALAMTLVALQHLPHLADTLLPIIIASTILFELGGPLLTRLALKHSGEIETP
jgi:Kef-type K+ transport system membrane component KefB